MQKIQNQEKHKHEDLFVAAPQQTIEPCAVKENIQRPGLSFREVSEGGASHYKNPH